MARAFQQMRQDWDRRARHDALYWVYTVHGQGFRDIETYYQDGGRHAVELLSLGTRKLGLDPRGKAILEIGCGIGRLFPGFAELGFSRIIGVDISREMIERGKKWCPVTNAEFCLVDGDRLAGVAAESVDYCLSYNVFQHLPRVEFLWRNIEEMSRVLKPGGCFQVHFRGAYSLKQRALNLLPSFLRQAVHILYRVASLKWLRGLSIFSDFDPGRVATWELGIAVPPQRMIKELRRMGFEDVMVTRDTGYADGRRFWATGRKSPRQLSS